MHIFLFRRQTDVTLNLKDPHYPDHDLGSILLSVLLAPREEQQEVVILNVLICVTSLVLRLGDSKHNNKHVKYDSKPVKFWD